jgi:hypothetical protein
VLSLLGIAHDVSERRTRLMSTPLLRYVLLFAAWCTLTFALRRPAELVSSSTLGLAVAMMLYFIIAHGVQRVSSFYRLVTVIFALGLFVAYVGVDQGLSPYQCVIYDPADMNDPGMPDGRECSVQAPDGAPQDGFIDCVLTGSPGVPYRCEHVGLFNTSSIGGRVRYLGVLHDPNELALATALALPFAFAFLEIRPGALRLALLLLALAVVGVEVVLTGSRGGVMMHLGLVGSLYACVKRLYPSYECALSWKEARNVFLAYAGGLVLWSAFIRHKGAWTLH